MDAKKAVKQKASQTQNEKIQYFIVPKISIRDNGLVAKSEALN